MKKRIYDNENLEKLLNRYIKEEKYGGFKPLLNEIFLRRAYEFGFDDKHMKKELNNFVKRLDGIKFGRNIPGLKESNVSTYRVNMKSGVIYFNCESNELQSDNIDFLNIYGCLTHEVYHAIKDQVKNGVLFDRHYVRIGKRN